jgi:hypothetical protein
VGVAKRPLPPEIPHVPIRKFRIADNAPLSSSMQRAKPLTVHASLPSELHYQAAHSPAAPVCGARLSPLGRRRHEGGPQATAHPPASAAFAPRGVSSRPPGTGTPCASRPGSACGPAAPSCAHRVAAPPAPRGCSAPPALAVLAAATNPTQPHPTPSEECHRQLVRRPRRGTSSWGENGGGSVRPTAGEVPHAATRTTVEARGSDEVREDAAEAGWLRGAFSLKEFLVEEESLASPRPLRCDVVTARDDSPASSERHPASS